MTEKLFAGIDVGTTTTKVVVINTERQLLGSFVRRTGIDLAGAAAQALDEALAQAGAGREAVQTIVGTGYGRKNIPIAHDPATEITCHGKGCFHYFPEAITVVDIGGQDNKIIKLDAHGRRTSFKMTRKCAAGTGAFLEEMAYKLAIPLSDLNQLAQTASQPTQIGSYCTVFTATEVLDRIRTGEKVNNIIRGLFDSVIKRIVEMDTLTGRVIMTGGVVAFNNIVTELLYERTGIRADVPPHPQEMGAFGAALVAQDFWCKPV